MAESTQQQQIPTYRLGDKIRIELKVSDRSGVDRVVAVFTAAADSTSGTTKTLRLEGKGGGETTTTVILEETVTEQISPGEYECLFVELYGVHGNHRVYRNPGIRFRIEDVPGDHEGPELNEWRVLPTE